MATDPYSAPRAHVADAPGAPIEGNFVPQGQSVPAGNGWAWISASWDFFKQQPGTWILTLIILIALMAVLSLIPVVNIATGLLGPVFIGGLMIGCRATEEGGGLEVGHLFAGFRDQPGKLILVGLFHIGAVFCIAVLMILIAFVTVGGSVLAQVSAGTDPSTLPPETLLFAALVLLVLLLVGFALLIPVYMAIWFAPALITLNGAEVGAALKTSFFACLRNIVPFLVYGVVMFLLSIVATVTVIGWIVLFPMFVASVYTAYRDIFYAR